MKIQPNGPMPNPVERSAIPPSDDKSLPGFHTQPELYNELLRDRPEFENQLKPRKEIEPLLPFFEPSNLEELTQNTVKQLIQAGSEFEKHRILDRYVAELNQADIWMTSYPPKPVYNYSEYELQALGQQVEEVISNLNLMARGPEEEIKLEAYTQVSEAIDLALRERRELPNMHPPFLKY